jgi:hypothetical protein
LYCVANACRKKTIFAVRKRRFTRAVGVSPPWFGRYVYADTRAIARKTAGSLWADHRCHRVQRYHGGLTPPLLVGNASAGRMMRIPAASSTGTSLRPGTRPAHMRIPAADSMRSPQLAHAIRSWLRVRTLLQMCDSGRRKRCFSTGGLHPPLLVAQCRFAGENGSRGAQRTSLRKTTFAVHNRTSTRAAGVSPPWSADRDAEGSASFSGNRTPSRAAGVSPPWELLTPVQ